MKISSAVIALGLALSAPQGVSGFSPVQQPSLSSPSALSMSSETTEATVGANPVIKVAAQGMSLLKPVFKLEAELQAAAFGAIANVDKEQVAQDLATTIQQNKVLIYTYGLSPFSTEALSILEASGIDYTKIELGAEWFLLGGVASETRVALSREVEGGATSLPKIFIGGKCIGGCAELAALAESGELTSLVKQAGVAKKGEKKTGGFGGFSFFN